MAESAPSGDTSLPAFRETLEEAAVASMRERTPSIRDLLPVTVTHAAQDGEQRRSRPGPDGPGRRLGHGHPLT